MSPSRGEPLPVVGPRHEGGRAEREGWTRRFVTSGPRLDEAVDLYRSMGLEVRLEPAGPPAHGEVCRACEPALRQSHVIYTRRPS